MDYNEKVITAARKTWNELSELCDETVEVFSDNQGFESTYETLVRVLFNRDGDKE